MNRARSNHLPFSVAGWLLAPAALLVPSLVSSPALAQQAVSVDAQQQQQPLPPPPPPQLDSAPPQPAPQPQRQPDWAPPPPQPDWAAPPQPEGAPRERPIERETIGRVELGYRQSFVTNAGYNPFSASDYLPQFSLLVSRALYVAHPFAFAAGIAWDYASAGALARGSQSSLTLDRLTIPLEGRLHFSDWGYAFVRAAPGVAFLRTEVDDPSAPAPLAKERWLFATDASAGYAFPILPRTHESGRTPRGWLEASGGYGWVASERLDLMPGGGASGVDLGTLALNGAFFRIAVAASY